MVGRTKIRSGRPRARSRFDRSPAVRACLSLLALVAVAAATPATVAGQTSNEITAVTPNSAAQGTADLLVTFTLDTDSPPAPPAGVMPTSVMIGTLAGASITHATQYAVTAIFAIPAGEAVGAKDVTVVFPLPGGSSVTFAENGGFAVTAGTDMPPSISQHPQSQRVPPGGSVTFTVTAAGTEPLRYQWQEDGGDLPEATDASYSIDPVAESDAGDYRCVVTNDYGSAVSNEAVLTVAELPTGSYPVVDTGQTKCYDDAAEIACPHEGQAFYGQDSECQGRQPSFTIGEDGLTVHDNVTGLTWQRSPDTDGDGTLTAADKLTCDEAQAWPAELNAASFAGYSDWRLPTIKELYSLIDFRGTDPSGMIGDDTSGLTPFIDTDYFQFAYGQTSAGERIIDSQYASSNLYVGPEQGGEGGKLFGVNFADGRIKGYGLHVAGSDKTFFVQCVRGNTDYGINNFVDNGDGTVTDRATGLMWSQDDSGTGVTWEQALAWAQSRNEANYLGHDDWRLPNAKELESLVDYTRAPDALDPAHQGPAIDPAFTCTQITNEACEADYPWYWAGTTHGSFAGEAGGTGVYVCFGRALGYMDGWVDVHGAGAQRSDPKSGSLSNYTHAGCGYYNSVAPQGDAVRISNYVRLVRDADSTGGSDLGDGGVPPAPSIRAAPNPIRSATDVLFTLPAAGWVRVSVFDVSGRFVKSLVKGRRAAGSQSVLWDGTDSDGRSVASGAYVIVMACAGARRSAKLTLLR
jgi:hypothetical protein